MPGVRNGDADAIHDARVATRRTRAVLAILDSDHDTNHDALSVEMRRLGRARGEARDLDIVVGLFEEKVRQVPERRVRRSRSVRLRCGNVRTHAER